MPALTLFPDDPPAKLPHRRGSTTSRHAAELAKPFANRQLVRVYQFFVDHKDDGATDEECQLATGLAGDSQRPRRQWLVTRGYLRNSGNMRLTTKGRSAVVHLWTGKTLPTATASDVASAEQPQPRKETHHAYTSRGHE